MSHGIAKIQACLLIISICALDDRLSAAQLIYPDQFELMRSTSFSPYPYANGRQPSVYSPAYGSPRAVNAAPAQNYNPDQVQNSPPPQLPEYSQVQTSQIPVSYASPAVPFGNFDNVAAGPPQSSSLPSNYNIQVYEGIYKGVTKFAIDMNNAIYNSRRATMVAQPENVVFSPLNVGSALALVLLGSAGYTFDEVARVLGFGSTQVSVSEHSELYHQMLGFLLSVLTSNVAQPGYPQISVGSALFVQQDYPIRPEYMSVSANVYNSEVINLDFRSAGMQAQKIINDWVNMRTMGKISSILDDIPNPETSVIIASALYFKGEWNQYFINGATKRRPFNIEPGQSVDVDLMYNGGQFPFYEDPTLGVKILGLPYKGLDVVMYVLLPKAPGASALRAFESQLSAERIEYLIDRMQNKTCIVGLPRMKLSSTLSLKSTLKSLNLNTLFDQTTSDLSVLSDRFPNLPTATPTSNPQTRPGKSNDNFVFPRFGDDTDQPPRTDKRNHIRYQDRNGGYIIEQWSTGFYIKKLDRLRKERGVDIESDHLYADQGFNNRQKRQTQQSSNENFIRYVESLNFTSTGVDNLRNSGRLRNPGLYADDVLHKVVIDIDEKGTEAAASTAVLLERDGNQKRLIANRPFLFFIRHEPTKLILFWGSINTPTPNYPTG